MTRIMTEIVMTETITKWMSLTSDRTRSSKERFAIVLFFEKLILFQSGILYPDMQMYNKI